MEDVWSTTILGESPVGGRLLFVGPGAPEIEEKLRCEQPRLALFTKNRSECFPFLGALQGRRILPILFL